MRNTDDRERHRGRELAWNGRVNEREPLINVVRSDKPKTLTGLSQKARGRESGSPLFPTVDRMTTGEQAGPTPFEGIDTERGKPTRFLERKATRKGSR